MKKPILQVKEGDFLKTDNLLRKRSALVKEFGAETQKTIENLVDTLNSHDIAVGLSAVQIGVLSRIFVVDTKKIVDATGETQRENGVIAMINPKILSKGKKTEKQMEACMSLPFIQGEVERSLKITIEYQTSSGLSRQLVAKKFLARVILHELDHLDGILYIDRMPPNSPLIPADFLVPQVDK